MEIICPEFDTKEYLSTKPVTLASRINQFLEDALYIKGYQIEVICFVLDVLNQRL